MSFELEMKAVQGCKRYRPGLETIANRFYVS